MSQKLGWHADTGHIVNIKDLKYDIEYWYSVVRISDYEK